MYRVVQKSEKQSLFCLWLCQILIDLQNSFTVWKRDISNNSQIRNWQLRPLHAFRQWKNFENQLRFDKVRGKKVTGTHFLDHPVHVKYLYMFCIVFVSCIFQVQYVIIIYYKLIFICDDLYIYQFVA